MDWKTGFARANDESSSKEKQVNHKSNKAARLIRLL
jgi:hypothetical protein